jgi:RNA polymerase-binding transcription factor DksA
MDDVDSAPDLAALRGALKRRRAELRREVSAAELARRTPVDRTEIDDRKDDAVRLQVDEVAAAEEERDATELRQIEAALGRLTAGTYGDCVDCGARIDPARLRALPAAERCAACQVAAEHRAHRAG